ncbi:MAG: RidA family protein [Candidatus Bipolaricaulia bacterium]
MKPPNTGQETGAVERLRISSAAPWEPIVGYSRAVRVRDTVYVAGTTASDAEGRVVGEGDAYAQTRYALEKVKWALHQARAARRHVVCTRFYVTDISRWREYGRAHAEFFGEIRPALTMVEVQGLVDPKMLIEVEAIAVLDSEPEDQEDDE